LPPKTRSFDKQPLILASPSCREPMARPSAVLELGPSVRDRRSSLSAFHDNNPVARPGVSFHPLGSVRNHRGYPMEYDRQSPCVPPIF
jgi:hypothetical protein